MDTTGIYFDCLCRTCMIELAEGSSYDGSIKRQLRWQSIFDIIEEECGAFPISELLTNAVPQIEVQPSDELPKRICSKCLQQLLSVYHFQQMCLQSQEQMRQQVSKKQCDLKVSMKGTAMEGEIGSTDAGSHRFPIFHPSNTNQTLELSSIAKPLLETTEHIVKPEAAETSNDDINQSLEDCRDAEGKFLKNEPIEVDERSSKYSDGEAALSAISVKAESIEFEEQQINETVVKAHRITHCDEESYECPYCPRRYKSKRNMLEHKKTHKGEREECDICGKSFSKKFLKEHKLIHCGEEALKCHLCEKSFAKNSLLRIHIRKHTGEKPYKCKYCQSSFSQSYTRLTHMRRAHLGDNVHRCELCPLAFPAASELRTHCITHKDEGPETRERNMKALKEAEAKLELKSPQQQSEMKAEKDVKAHRIIHDIDKPYECPYCPRRFNAKSNMYQHKAIHEGVKEEPCDICGKSFRKNYLKTHKQIHSNDKSHKCDICEKRFVQLSHLKCHIVKHTGEKPYKCKYCERSFSSTSPRLKHIRIHLGDNVHRCELCPLAFPTASELRTHFKSHKNEDPETRERNMKALKEAEDKLQQQFVKKAKV